MTADLEDAVAPAEKASARELACRVLGEVESTTLKTIRVNGADTEFFDDDCVAIRELPLAGIVLPKATPEAVEALGDSGPPVIAIVESAQGLRLAYETACLPRVAALMLGAVDLAAELRLSLAPTASRSSTRARSSSSTRPRPASAARSTSCTCACETTRRSRPRRGSPVRSGCVGRPASTRPRCPW